MITMRQTTFPDSAEAALRPYPVESNIYATTSASSILVPRLREFGHGKADVHLDRVKEPSEYLGFPETTGHVWEVVQAVALDTSTQHPRFREQARAQYVWSWPEFSLPAIPEFLLPDVPPRIMATLTQRARAELQFSPNTQWAVDESVVAIRGELGEIEPVTDIEVDAIQDAESPPPRTIEILVRIRGLDTKDRFAIWNRLAEVVEVALQPWRPDHRIVVTVKRGRRGDGSAGLSEARR